MIMSILTSTSTSCSFYSYIYHLPCPSPTPSFSHYTLIGMFYLYYLYDITTIGTISLKSIDHENICCLNTILLLLLLSHHRGQLPEILTSIRRIANEDKLKENEQRDRERRDAGLAVESDEPYDEEDREVMSGGAMLLLNFRELLWFWKEYYCRRGRDRLSLEFR